MKAKHLGLKFAVFFAVLGLVTAAARGTSFSFTQIVSVVIFSASIMATLLFWEFRVAIAFWGISALVLTKTIDIEHLIAFSSLEVILFLVGMMVIIGLLREVNFFNWILCRLVTLKGMTAVKLVVLICLSSALMACLVDEVTSIVFMVGLVFALADYFEIKPAPLLITTVMATNIGSAGTVLGNPIGILIATKAGLSFEDFLLRAFPLMLVVLLATIGLLLFWYKQEFKKMDEKLKEHEGVRGHLERLICVPMTKEIRKEFLIFLATLILLGLHHRLEYIFGLAANSLLLAIPLFAAGFIMIWRSDKAREYIEKDVDWWTLIFFMLLFAKVGTLKYTGVTDSLARAMAFFANGSQFFMMTFVLWGTAIGSSILDNVVVVATFIPVISELKNMGVDVSSLWWALLFGGCLGGNITMVGSTANIVALGMLEKRDKLGISFGQWFKIGSVVGLITTAIAWVVLIISL